MYNKTLQQTGQEVQIIAKGNQSFWLIRLTGQHKSIKPTCSGQVDTFCFWKTLWSRWRFLSYCRCCLPRLLLALAKTFGWPSGFVLRVWKAWWSRVTRAESLVVMKCRYRHIHTNCLCARMETIFVERRSSPATGRCPLPTVPIRCHRWPAWVARSWYSTKKSIETGFSFLRSRSVAVARAGWRAVSSSRLHRLWTMQVTTRTRWTLTYASSVSRRRSPACTSRLSAWYRRERTLRSELVASYRAGDLWRQVVNCQRIWEPWTSRLFRKPAAATRGAVASRESKYHLKTESGAIYFKFWIISAWSAPENRAVTRATVTVVARWSLEVVSLVSFPGEQFSAVELCLECTRASDRLESETLSPLKPEFSGLCIVDYCFVSKWKWNSKFFLHPIKTKKSNPISFKLKSVCNI